MLSHIPDAGMESKYLGPLSRSPNIQQKLFLYWAGEGATARQSIKALRPKLSILGGTTQADWGSEDWEMESVQGAMQDLTLGLVLEEKWKSGM